MLYSCLAVLYAGSSSVSGKSTFNSISTPIASPTCVPIWVRFGYSGMKFSSNVSSTESDVLAELQFESTALVGYRVNVVLIKGRSTNVVALIPIYFIIWKPTLISGRKETEVLIWKSDVSA